MRTFNLHKMPLNKTCRASIEGKGDRGHSSVVSWLALLLMTGASLASPRQYNSYVSYLWRPVLFTPKSLRCIIYAANKMYWILPWHFNKILSVQLKQDNENHNICLEPSIQCFHFHISQILMRSSVIQPGSDSDRVAGRLVKHIYISFQHLCPRPIMAHCICHV